MMADQACDDTQSWCEHGPVAAAAHLSGVRSLAPMPAGHLLADRFELRERVGAGGMGVVYRAFDLELEETVAIKMLHPALQGGDARASELRREVRSTRRVASPHVARMYELHHDATLAFLVMEFIDGPSLAAWLGSGATSTAAALRIAMDVGRGLAAAHRVGVVHRDVKPANVLLRRCGAAVLTDFGLAHVMAEGAKAVTLGAAGTPAYMAPEQLLGQRLGPSADVFALGALTYELLSGILPWRGDSPVEQAMARVHAPALELTPRDAAVGVEIIDWVRRALQRDAAQRWPDGAEALAALESAVRRSRLSPPADRPAATIAAPPERSSSRAVPLLWLHSFTVASGAADLIPIAEEAHADAAIRLGQQRGLRLLDGDPLRRRLEDGEDGDAIARSVGAALRALVRVGHRRDGLRAHVRVVAVDGGEIVGSAAIDLARADAERLGDIVAERIDEAIGLQSTPRHDADSRASIGDALVAMAKRNLCSLDPAKLDVAAALLKGALERRPADPGLRILRAWALAQHWYASGAIRPARIAELRAALPTLDAGPELPAEALLALAQIRYLAGDSVEAARLSRRVIAAAPSLPLAHEFLGRLLLECDAGSEGEARLAAASRLAPLRLQARLARCRWLALTGDWDAHDAELADLEPEPGELVLRWTWQARACLWRGDRRGLAALRDELRSRTGVNADDAGVAGVEATIRAALGEGGCDIATSLASQRSPRANAEALQLCAELYASRGQLDEALIALTASIGAGSHSLAWLERCPLLAEVRELPGILAVQASVAARALAVRLALHEVDSAA